ncbi:hypothetical protein BKA61DRAFT_677051 [Leptodontidium sp. MPI-SDFR-AT-0119]|nr:hypothetical protein BKA61DRAFT_677051 [Leptodontidium sp. MPI-SDFR-AT-0119]
MSEILDTTVISSTSSPSPPTGTCYQPVLTVKSFFASFGICVGAYLLIYGILWLIAKIMERRTRKPARAPTREYYHKFAGTLMSMKRTIVYGENIPGLVFKGLYRPQGDTRPIGPKDHLASSH